MPTALTTRIARLQQFQTWIDDDPDITSFIDSVINKRVQAATRRQVIISFIVAVVSLIAGWLLNAISPWSLLPH